MRVVSLFSGIGGFELGLARAGFQTVMMCESDPLARSVLRHHFPGIPIRTDIRTLKRLPACEILTAGWTCQDLSQAGRTAGIAGDRSGLISEVFRLVQATKTKPEFILLENVAFALHLQKGAALMFVTSHLEMLGYNWAYRILDSQHFGVPQRRRRLFILASRQLAPETILFRGALNTSLEAHSHPQQYGFYWTEGNRGLGWSPEAVPPLKGGSSLSIPSPPAIWNKDARSFVTPGVSDAERMQGFPEDWTDVGALRNVKKRARWKLVGNAVSVPVVEWIAKSLAEEVSIPLEIVPAKRGSKIGTAAFGQADHQAIFLNPGHEGPEIPQIATLRDFELKDASKLSLRAATGFLSRIEKSSLRTDPAFISDLRAFVG